MELFLVLNGYEINATTAEQVAVVLQIASSEMVREDFTNWLRAHVEPMA